MYQRYVQNALAQAQGQPDGQSLRVRARKSFGSCISDYCEGMRGSFTRGSEAQGGTLEFGIKRGFPVGTRPLEVDLYWHRADASMIPWQSPVSQSHQYLQSFSISTYNMENVTVPYGDGYYKLFIRPWGITPSDHMGGGTYRVCVSACP